MEGPTPSQTVGPYFAIGLCTHAQNEPAAGGVALQGRVLDGAGAAVPDAVVEVWAPPHFGRCPTDRDGGYRFAVEPPAAGYATLLVFARGLLKPVLTRAYWPGRSDALLEALEPDERRGLTAAPDGSGVRFDIHLQGENQTPFLCSKTSA